MRYFWRIKYLKLIIEHINCNVLQNMREENNLPDHLFKFTKYVLNQTKLYKFRFKKKPHKMMQFTSLYLKSNNQWF